MKDGGVLPEGWASTSIGEVGWVTKLAGFEFTKYIKYDETESVRVVRGLNVGFGEFRATDFKYIDEATSNSLPRSRLYGGELLMAYVGSLGTTAILPSDGNRYHLGPNVAKVVVESSLCNAKYLMYYVLSPKGQYQVHITSKAVAQSSLSMQQIRALNVPLAPLLEQRRIVEAIEQQFTRLDAGVAALKRAQAALKRYRAAVLKAAVEGKLTAAWRAEHPNVEPASDLLQRILDERRAMWEADVWAKGKDPAKTRYDAPEAPDAANLPELPEGWCWATIDILAHVAGGITKGRDLSNRITVTLPYLRVANVQRGFVDLAEIKLIEVPEDEVERYLLHENDVLLTEGGDADKLGRAAVWHGQVENCAHQNHIFRARLIHSKMPSSWLEYYANSEQGQGYFRKAAKQTVNLASINLTQLRGCPIPLSSLEEQEQIVTAVEERLSIVSELEATIEANLKRADRLRQGILERAFEGKLVPQHPDDEPATVLLERIREQREGGTPVRQKPQQLSGSAGGEQHDTAAFSPVQASLWRGE